MCVCVLWPQTSMALHPGKVAEGAAEGCKHPCTTQSSPAHTAARGRLKGFFARLAVGDLSAAVCRDGFVDALGFPQHKDEKACE